MLTGDSLFVGGIARPDLAVDPREGAHGIFHSLHDRLLTLPDTCEVWPGHLGGSMCGGPGIDLKVSSTIGYERAHQEVLGVVDEEEFVERAVAGLGPQPPNFRAIVAINTGPLTRGAAHFDPLTPRQVEQHQRDGALLVDVRTELQFDDAHIPGAICITVLRAGFGSRLAWLADHDQPVIVVGRDDDDARRAIGLAGSVGVTNVAGYLAGGMTSWREEQRRGRAHPAHDGARAARALGARRRRCRSSTCASAANGTAATSPARCTCPTTTSTRSAGIDAAVPGGGDLRLGPARGGRRQPARPPRRARGHPRRRRRRRARGAARGGPWRGRLGRVAPWRAREASASARVSVRHDPTRTDDRLPRRGQARRLGHRLRLPGRRSALHIPGRSAFAGRHLGKQAAVGYIQSIRERYPDGAIELEVIDMLASDERVILLVRERFHGEGPPVEIRRANVYRVKDGKVVEVSIFEADQYVVDELLH